MVDSTRFLLFLTAAVMLAIAPGPGMLYVLARSLAGGKREGVLSAFGTFVGGMMHVFAAALGVSIVLAKSAVAFASTESAVARRCDRGSESQDCPILSLFYSAIRQPRERTRLLAIRDAGLDFSGHEHYRRLDCDRAGGTAWRAHSLVGHFPAKTENGHRRNHDWVGNLSGTSESK